ncbi:hypothetical protein GCM10023215_18850 [Pseudonocardia yuanmonensis]|uniref:PPE family protein n=1 Tax=Pseudonocardia yuanmonensis TaxID=1095914 RepID=A0ABP8W9J5_9PSEU
MAERTYSGTAVAFEGMTLPEIRDPVASGPGPGSMRAAEQALAEVSRKLADVNAELEALEREYADAHEGEAAEVTRMYLRKLGEPGRVGTAMFQLAARALGDQAEYYTVAHRELAALQPTDSPIGNSATSQLALERQQSAAHVATRYQENSNANLSSAFQAFTPLTLPTPDTSAVAPAAAPGWPGGGAALPGTPSGTATVAPGAGATPAIPPGAPVPIPTGPQNALAAGIAPAATPASGAPAATRSVRSGGVSAAGAPAATASADLAPTPVAGLNRPPTGSAALPLPSGDRPLPRRAPIELRSGVLSPSVPRTTGARPLDRTGLAVPSNRLGESVRSVTPRTAEPLPRPAPTEPLPRSAPAEPLPRSAAGERLRAAEPLTEPARTGAAARTPSSHLPYLPAGVGGRRAEPHPRPDWLVEDDPEGVWLADVPAYGPAVLRGEDRCAGP